MPEQISKRVRGALHPEGQQMSRKPIAPTISSTPAYPRKRAIPAPIGTLGPGSAAVAATGPAWPTANVNDPATGCESADTTRHITR